MYYWNNITYIVHIVVSYNNYLRNDNYKMCVLLGIFL